VTGEMKRTVTCRKGHTFTIEGEPQPHKQERIMSIACPKCEAQCRFSWPMGAPYTVSDSDED